LEHKGITADTNGSDIMLFSLRGAFEAIAFSALMMLILALPSLA
jgi:hypothetical protein